MAKILIIDDDTTMRTLIGRMLSDGGHDVLEAPDGALGLELLQRDGPSLVITDLLMPGKEGFETIRDLKGRAPKVPIIAISGRGVDYLSMARKLGADQTLAKPFKAGDLLAAVETLLAPTDRAAPGG
jgi:DNA-binding response OmpR family regulator